MTALRWAVAAAVVAAELEVRLRGDSGGLPDSSRLEAAPDHAEALCALALDGDSGGCGARGA